MNDFAGYILIKRALQQSPCTLNTSLMKVSISCFVYRSLLYRSFVRERNQIINNSYIFNQVINNSYIFSQALLESICDGDLFLTSGGDGSDDNDDDDDFESVAINQNTHAIVRNVCILQMLLKDWSLIRKADFDVQEILWQALETLVRPTHPHVKFNVVQFQRARIVENLLTGCQV